MKNKQFWLGLVVAILIFVTVTEISKSSNRKVAIEDLNSGYSTMTTDANRQALIMKYDTIIAENQSMFSFFNSKAGAPSRGGEEKSKEGEFRNGEGPNVSTYFVIRDKDGRFLIDGQ